MARKPKSWADIGDPRARQAAKAAYDEYVSKKKTTAAQVPTQSTADVRGAGTVSTAPTRSQDVRVGRQDLLARGSVNYSVPAQSTANLTGANNAAGVVQADYAPKFNLQDAIKNAFSGLGSAFNPRTGQRAGTTPTTQTQPQVTYPFNNLYGKTPKGEYPVPQYSKTIEERYQDYLNYQKNVALGYNTPYFPTPGETTATAGGGYGGGGGGYRGYGGRGRGRSGGYGNDGYSSQDYEKWLGGLLSRWNI